MEFSKSNMKKIALLIAFGIAFYLGVKNIARLSDLLNFIVGIFKPLLLGLVIAFILNVLMRQVEMFLFAPLNRRFKKRWPKVRRPLSILVTFLIVIGIIALIALIVVPDLVHTITNLSNNVPAYFTSLQNSIVKIKDNYPSIGKYLGKVNIDWSNVSQMLAQYGKSLASTLVNSTVLVATTVVQTIVTAILSVIFAIDILAQKEKLKVQIKSVLYTYLPQKPTDKFLRICNLTNHAFSNFIIGQCTEACILATLCFIGMNIFRFPYALLVSALVACMALIPIFGAFLSAALGALLILTVSPFQALCFVVFFIVLQQLEGNLIYPRVVGSKVGLPALWVLAAITVGGNAFGLFGMLVNIPICSVLYTLLRESVNKRLARDKEVLH